MAEQKGLEFLLAVSDGMSGWDTIMGGRSHRLRMNQELVDITNKDHTDRFRRALANAGVKTVELTGSGVFTDAAEDETVRADFFSTGALTSYRMTVPDFGTFDGAFVVASIEYGGEHNGEVTYDIQLQSAGAITFASI